MTPVHLAPGAGIDIRERQDPLRVRYRTDPGPALITDRGRTVSERLDDPVHMFGVPGIQDYGVQWELGVHRAVAGLHDGPNPGDLLCLALATCMDSVVRMIANRHGVALEHLEVDVTGDVDVRGTLLVSSEVPVGFQRLRCRVQARARPGTDPALLEKLIVAAERSCVNSETLRRGVSVEVAADVA